MAKCFCLLAVLYDHILSAAA